MRKRDNGLVKKSADPTSAVFSLMTAWQSKDAGMDVDGYVIYAVLSKGDGPNCMQRTKTIGIYSI